MITQAIRFLSVKPGAEPRQIGTAWITEDGELDYSSEAVEHSMAPMVARLGPEKAFEFYAKGGNDSYIRSEPFELKRADLDDNDLDEEVQRAVGHLDPDGEEFRKYWTRGEGLRKWLGHPHEWTSLRNHLLKYVGPERADRIASAWFHLVKGFWPGSDLHRVEHGKPPRGHVVGPG